MANLAGIFWVVLASSIQGATCFDANRAWEMARDIPADDVSTSLEAQRKIGIYLNATQAQRQDFSFGWMDDFRGLDELDEL